MGEWVTIREAAKILNCSITTLWAAHCTDMKTGRKDRFMGKGRATLYNIAPAKEALRLKQKLDDLYYEAYEICGSDREIGKRLIAMGIPRSGTIRPLQQLKFLLMSKAPATRANEHRRQFVSILETLIRNSSF